MKKFYARHRETARQAPCRNDLTRSMGPESRRRTEPHGVEIEAEAAVERATTVWSRKCVIVGAGSHPSRPMVEPPDPAHDRVMNKRQPEGPYGWLLPVRGARARHQNEAIWFGREEFVGLSGIAASHTRQCFGRGAPRIAPSPPRGASSGGGGGGADGTVPTSPPRLALNCRRAHGAGVRSGPAHFAAL